MFSQFYRRWLVSVAHGKRYGERIRVCQGEDKLKHATNSSVISIQLQFIEYNYISQWSILPPRVKPRNKVPDHIRENIVENNSCLLWLSDAPVRHQLSEPV